MIPRVAVVASFALAALVSSWVALAWDAEPTLLFPVAVAGIALIGVAWPHRQSRAGLLKAATVLLVLRVIVASFSVGVFYIPSAFAMAFASRRERARPLTP